MTRAVGYVRVSTGKQARDGLSLDEQVRRVEAYTAAHELEHAETFVEVISGRKADLPELHRLLARLHDFDTIVIPRIDRLGRNFTELARIKGELEAAGVALVCLDPQIDFSTSVGLLVWANLSAVAQFESHSIGERVAAVSAARAAEGKFPGGRYPPYGYRREDGELVVVGAQAVIVQRLYHETLAGRSQRQIAQGLEADGIRTQNGAEWTQGTIRRILTADVYRGMVELKGTVYPGRHEAIIDPELWDQAAQLRSGRAQAPGGGRGRPPAGGHLFTHGLLRCGECGSAMSPRTYPTGNAAYECRGTRDRGLHSCSQRPVARELIDTAVLRYFERAWLDVDATVAALRENLERDRAELRALREQAERQEREAVAALHRIRRDYHDGRLEAEDWREFRDELTEEQAGAAAEVERLGAREAGLEEQGELRDAEAEMLEHLTRVRAAVVGHVRDAEGIEAVRAALRRLFDRFTLLGDCQSIVFGEGNRRAQVRGGDGELLLRQPGLGRFGQGLGLKVEVNPAAVPVPLVLSMTRTG